MPEAWQVAIGSTCGILLLITSIVLIAVSFQSLELNTVGLDYNNNLKSVDSTKLWTPGRYFVGLGHGFIVYPTAVQENQLQMTCRSLDGMTVQISCSYQYQLTKEIDSVFSLYSQFDNDYSKAFDKIAAETVRNVAADFNSIQFFFNRSDITAAMEKAMLTSLSSLGATVPSFQLLNFDLPTAFQQALLSSQETRSMITRVATEQMKTEISASAQVATAVQDANIVVVKANATAGAFLLSKQAERDATLATLDAEREAYASLKRQLNLTADELLSLVWLSAIQDTAAPQMISVPQPTQLFGDSAGVTKGVTMKK